MVILTLTPVTLTCLITSTRNHMLTTTQKSPILISLIVMPTMIAAIVINHTAITQMHIAIIMAKPLIAMSRIRTSTPTSHIATPIVISLIRIRIVTKPTRTSIMIGVTLIPLILIIQRLAAIVNGHIAIAMETLIATWHMLMGMVMKRIPIHIPIGRIPMLIATGHIQTSHTKIHTVILVTPMYHIPITLKAMPILTLKLHTQILRIPMRIMTLDMQM